MERTVITRRNLLRIGIAGSTVGIAGLAPQALSMVQAGANGVSGPESTQVAEIYELQAAFHKAKTTQDLDLMMSLWAADAVFTNRSTGTTYVGFDSIKSFWQGSGSLHPPQVLSRALLQDEDRSPRRDRISLLRVS
jgi:hypothetical protein